MNVGGFILICNLGNTINQDAIIRYNISQNDGLSIFNILGTPTNTLIYNNTIFIGPNGRHRIVGQDEWEGVASASVYFYNNVFYNRNNITEYKFLEEGLIVFDYNIFYGTYSRNTPPDAHKLMVDPLMVNVAVLYITPMGCLYLMATAERAIIPLLISYALLLLWQSLACTAVRKAGAGAVRRKVSWLVSGLFNATLPLGLMVILSAILWLMLDREYFVRVWLLMLTLFLPSVILGLFAARTSRGLRSLPDSASRQIVPVRWYLVGYSLLTGLALMSAYIVGAGGLFNLARFAIDIRGPMSPGYILPPTATLKGIVITHYATSVGVWMYCLFGTLIGLGSVTLIIWLVDRYGMPIITWRKGRPVEQMNE